MALLLYKSNEMFSSTELIRKSKMIFDKILGRKIEKAIILRDGKPSFLLMEFAKYEKIMAEYEELKEYISEMEEGTIPKKKVKVRKSEEKKKKKEKSEADKKLKEELVENSKRIAISKMDYVEDIQKKRKEQEEVKKAESEKLVEKTEEIPNEDMVEDISATEEISEAFSSIDSMDIDESKKEEAKAKIKAKILEARKARESMELEDPKQKKQEEQLEEQIAEDKLKKEQELEEFWD